MSLMDSLFSTFRPQPAAQSGAQNLQGNQNPTNNPARNDNPSATENSPGTAPNGVVPKQDSDSNAQGTKSPLEKFEKLWENEVSKEGNTENQNSGPTPQQMMEAAAKVDFSRVIDQENLQKVLAGGEGAAQALVAILNKQAQTVYGQSTVVAQKLVEKAVEDAQAKFASQIPDFVRRQVATDSLSSENPNFRHPAVQPVVGMVQAQLAQKFPNATASEIRDMAKEFLKEAAGVFNPSSDSNSSSDKGSSGSSGKKKTATEDWDTWFSTQSNS